MSEAAVDALVLARANGQRARRLAPPITSIDELWSPESWQAAARRTLTEVVPVLHPTIPNTLEALEALAVGSGAQAVIRGLDQDDDPVTAICVSWDSEYLGLWVTDGSDEWRTESLVDITSHEIRLTEWTVLWPLGGVA